MPTASSRPAIRVLYWAMAFGIAGGLLVLSLRGIAWAQVWRTVSSASLPLSGLACLTATGSYCLRALRWRLLLTVDRRIAFWPVFCANMAGYLGNNFLPARAGELVRSAMISGRTGMPVARVLTTALAERLVDVAVLVSWTPLVLWTLRDKPEWMARAAAPTALIAAAGVLALIALPFLGSALTRCIRRLPVRPALQDRLVGVLGHILDGLRSFHDPARSVRYLALTAAIWATDAFTCIVIARGLGMALGVPAALLLLTGLGLGSALPATPGYVGIYQFVAVTVLAPFGYSKDKAIAFILVTQALGYVVITVWGVAGLWEYRRSRPPA